MKSQSQLIRDSFEQIEGAATAIAMLFYGRLFELDPSVKPMFKSDIRTQSRKLMDTLAAVVAAADRLQAMKPELRALGKLHVTHGVKPAHYDTVRIALLWALGQALQGDFDAETRSAWDQFLRTASEEMIAGANEGN
jgi:hemoglobin-like flavoprotein